MFAYALRDENCLPAFHKIHVPTGIFHGEKDTVVPFALAEMTHNAISGSILYPFTNSGPGIVVDELDSFNQALLNFLNKSFQ